MRQLVMERDEVKSLIWRLDAALAGFNGVDWMENVGKVARLKEGFFRSTGLVAGNLCPLCPVELEALNCYLDVLDHKDVSSSLRSDAFDKAVSLITLLLHDPLAQ